MIKSDKAVMQQALDWMYSHGEIVFAGGGMNAVDPMNKAAAALRETIALPEKPTIFKLLTHSQKLEMFWGSAHDRATDYESYIQAIDDYESTFKVQVDSSYNGDEIAELKLNGPTMERGTDEDGKPFMGTMRQVMEDYRSAADAEAKEVDRLNAEIMVLHKALQGLVNLYDTDEGCKALPEYVVANALLAKPNNLQKSVLAKALRHLHVTRPESES